jgi:hypothetical protein
MSARDAGAPYRLAEARCSSQDAYAPDSVHLLSSLAAPEMGQHVTP